MAAEPTSLRVERASPSWAAPKFNSAHTSGCKLLGSIARSFTTTRPPANTSAIH